LPETAPRWIEIEQELVTDDTAKVVERQVNSLDHTALDNLYQGVGSLAYDPRMLLKMVLYQYLKGRRSPATWFEEAKLNQAMQWLGRGYTPARRTWYEFRNRIGGAIDQLHQTLINQATAQGLLTAEVGVQDGTSVAACASRHKMVIRKTLDQRRELLNEVMEGTAGAERPIPRWVPPTAKGRKNLARRMEIAADVLKSRITKNTEKPAGKRKDPEKIRVSLSDPIAPLGRDKQKVYRPLYTVQYLIEPLSRLILSYGCDAAVTDTGTLIPMIDKTQQIVNGRLKTIIADAAYCSILDLRDCAQRGIELLAPVQTNSFTEKKKQSKPEQKLPRDQFHFDTEQNLYRCPAGNPLPYRSRSRKQRHGDRKIWESRYSSDPADCASCSLAAQCLNKGKSRRMVKRLEGQELLDDQRTKMEQPEVQAKYSIRGQTVELGFADAKEHRGLRRFHGRGIARARTESGLLVLAQNVLRLDRLQRKSLNPSKETT
jgi:transposase